MSMGLSEASIRRATFQELKDFEENWMYIKEVEAYIQAAYSGSIWAEGGLVEPKTREEREYERTDEYKMEKLMEFMKMEESRNEALIRQYEREEV